MGPTKRDKTEFDNVSISGMEKLESKGKEF